MPVGQSRQRSLRLQLEGCAGGQQRAERRGHQCPGGARHATAHGVPDGVPDEPANILRPSASVTVAAFAVFDPSLARNASTVISSPNFNDRLLQPSRIRPFGLDVSIIHSVVFPSASGTASVIQPCGLIISHFTTVPLSVTGFCASNSAANE